MALFLLSLNLGWIQGQFNFTENSLHYLATRPESQSAVILSCLYHSPLSVGFAGKRFFITSARTAATFLRVVYRSLISFLRWLLRKMGIRQCIALSTPQVNSCISQVCINVILCCFSKGFAE